MNRESTSHRSIDTLTIEIINSMRKSAIVTITFPVNPLCFPLTVIPLHQSSAIHNKRTSPAEVLTNQRSFVSIWKIDDCFLLLSDMQTKALSHIYMKIFSFLWILPPKVGYMVQFGKASGWKLSCKVIRIISYRHLRAMWLKIASNARLSIEV